MATSSYERLLELAHQRAIDGKGGLAASIAEMCLAAKSDLTARELALAFDILRMLVDQVEVQIRRHIADYLAERDDVPHDLITFLANDEITVSYPILVHSKLLKDEDLIEIILSRTQRHRLAIAIRPNLTEQVSDHLIGSNDVEVITTLLCNDTAQIYSESLARLVDQSIEIEQYREPLLHRRDLPVDLAQRMYAWVGDALRGYIAAHFDIKQTTLEDSVSTALAQALKDELFGEKHPTRIRRSPGPRDTIPGHSLVAALKRGDRAGFEGSFADLIDLPINAVAIILYDSGHETLAIACRAGGLDRTVFSDILCHLAGGKSPETFKTTDEYARAMTYFDRIDYSGAMAVVESWRRTPDTVWRK